MSHEISSSKQEQNGTEQFGFAVFYKNGNQ